MRGKASMRCFLGAIFCIVGTFAGAAVTETEPNDAVPQALGTLSSSPMTIFVDGTSEYAGDIDWFSFEVGGSAPQSIRLATESDAVWLIVLLAEDSSHIASGTSSLTHDLAPGRYRVRVQPSELGTGSYMLLLSNALEREPNDGLVEAASLGTLEDEPLSAFAAISPAGDVDFFSFDVPKSSEASSASGSSRVVRIETPCPAGDTLLILYAEDETLGRPVPIARNDDSGEQSWSRLYIVDPEPGRYTLRVHEYADNERIDAYRIVITEMTMSETEPNDTLDDATTLGALGAGGHLTATQFIAEGDIDAFTFDVVASTCVLLETSGPAGGDSLICLFSETGDDIACDDDGGDSTWSRLSRRLDAGRYLATVRASDQRDSFDYTLTLATTSCPSEGNESEPNDSTGTADLLTLPHDVSAEVAAGNADVYRFELETSATVVAETYGEADGDTTICLLDADGNTIACDDDGGDGLWSLIRYELARGTYFARVELFAGTGTVPYHLVVRVED